jgi:hypothetical protein
MGSVGLIGIGSVFGSLVTVIVTHFLEKGKLKTERESNLQREIYFKQQEQSGKLFEEINLMGRQVQEIKFWMQKNTVTPMITNIPVVERIAKISSLQAYFPKEIIEKHNEVALIFGELLKIYYEIGKKCVRTQKDCDDIMELLKKHNEQSNELVRDILKELERNKNLIV